MFGIGLQEMIILAFLGFVVVGVPVIILVVVIAQKKNRDD